MLLIKVIRDGANEQAEKDSVGVGALAIFGETGILKEDCIAVCFCGLA